jgi:hypothetical protein
MEITIERIEIAIYDGLVWGKETVSRKSRYM